MREGFAPAHVIVFLKMNCDGKRAVVHTALFGFRKQKYEVNK